MLLADALSVEDALEITALSQAAQTAFYEAQCSNWKDDEQFRLHNVATMVSGYRHDPHAVPVDISDATMLLVNALTEALQGVRPEDEKPKRQYERREDGNVQEVLATVTVRGQRSFANLQHTYWDYKKKGIPFSSINDKGLRNWMYRHDETLKFTRRVQDMTRTQAKVTLEVASWFIPMGWVTKIKYLRYAASLLKIKRAKVLQIGVSEAGVVAVNGGDNIVYHTVENGVTQYVGITNDLARRAAEHLRTKGIHIEQLMQGLSRSDAKAVEQALIEIHGLGKNGGTLINKINSIATSNPSYAAQVRRGGELLESIGYK